MDIVSRRLALVSLQGTTLRPLDILLGPGATTPSPATRRLPSSPLTRRTIVALGQRTDSSPTDTAGPRHTLPVEATRHQDRMEDSRLATDGVE